MLGELAWVVKELKRSFIHFVGADREQTQRVALAQLGEGLSLLLSFKGQHAGDGVGPCQDPGWLCLYRMWLFGETCHLPSSWVSERDLIGALERCSLF